MIRIKHQVKKACPPTQTVPEGMVQRLQKGDIQTTRPKRTDASAWRHCNSQNSAEENGSER